MKEVNGRFHFGNFLYLNMITYQINVLNPKADKLLQDLADLDLISIQKSTEDAFIQAINDIQEGAAAANPPTLEEIIEEVELVRAARYAKTKG